MFLSDGQDNEEDNSVSTLRKMMRNKHQEMEEENMDDYSVYSFGYGEDHDKNILNSIAENAKG